MGSATSQSGHQCSSKTARKFPQTFRETPSRTAIFAIGERPPRSQSSARSMGRICVIGGAHKKGTVADGELFHRIGRGTRASQLPRKILAEIECHRLPTLEKSR